MQMLVSNKVAGTVIGRGGATISTIQNASGSRVRVSNNGEFFPGTQDRVVLVTGETGAVSQGSVPLSGRAHSLCSLRC